MSRKRKRGEEPKDKNVLEFNRDLSLIEHAVKFNGIKTINELFSMLNGDGWGTKGSIEHLPHEIKAAKIYIKEFLGKEYQNKTDDQGRIYITQEDIDSLETALGELNKYTYPKSNKNKYGTITNWEEIIKDLDSKLKPIFIKIRESYMKYLPENERVMPFAPLETQEEEEETVNASVGGRRRKYRKKRTKKRRKSKGIKRRKSRRKKRRKSRRRKRTRKRR
tara:strand:- start:564 stop:1226 length:663 start_codon:yes stop_codon:yes gene_type:complete